MLSSAIAYLTSFIRTNLHEIAFGITAVTMVLAGPHINRNIQSIVRNLHWLLRYAVFVLLCTGGYALLSQAIYRGVKHVLHSLSNPLLIIVTAGVYLLLAWVAKGQKKF
jgi:hypothetical protein